VILKYALLSVLIVALPIPSIGINVIAANIQITVKIVDWDGEGIPGLGIIVTYFKSASDRGELFYGKTDENGVVQFTIDSLLLSTAQVVLHAYYGTYKVLEMEITPYQTSYVVKANVFDVKVRLIEDDGDVIDQFKVRVWWDEINGSIIREAYCEHDFAEVDNVVGTEVNIAVEKLGVEILFETIDVGPTTYDLTYTIPLKDLTVKVVDERNTPIPEAYVKVCKDENAIDKYTNSEGEAIFHGLPSGTYTIIASYRGAKRMTKIAILNSDLNVSIQLSTILPTKTTTTSTATPPLTVTGSITTTTNATSTSTYMTTTTPLSTSKPETIATPIATTKTVTVPTIQSEPTTTTIIPYSTRTTTYKPTTTVYTTTSTPKTTTTIESAIKPMNTVKVIVISPVEEGELHVYREKNEVWYGSLKNHTAIVKLRPGRYTFKLISVEGETEAKVEVLEGINEQIVHIDRPKYNWRRLEVNLLYILSIMSMFLIVMILWFLRYKRRIEV